MRMLATIHELRLHLGMETSDTSSNARLRSALEAATAAIERAAGRSFIPQQATLAHDVQLNDLREIALRADLLTLEALLNGDGQALDLAQVLHLPGALRLTGGAYFTYDETPLRAVQVTGLWGTHDDWAHAFRDSGDSVQDALNATATSFYVSSAEGADTLRITPRFQVGHLLRIGDELLWLLALDAGTNTLYVQRGAQGTMPSEHEAGTPIAIYQPPRAVHRLCLRWAAWLYREPDSAALAEPFALADAVACWQRVRVA